MICKCKREGTGQGGRGSRPRFGHIWAGEFGPCLHLSELIAR